MQPYNYVLPNQPGMMDAYAEGQMIQARQNELQAQADDRRMKAEQLKAAMEQARATQAIKDRFFSIPSGQHTWDDRMALAMAVGPQMTKEMMPMWESMSKENRSGEIRHGMEVISAIDTNRPDIAIQLLSDRAKAEKDPAKSRAYTAAAEAVKVNPEFGIQSALNMFAGFPEGKEAIDNYTKARADVKARALMAPEVKKATAEADEKEADATLKKAQAINAVPLATAALEKAQGDAQESQVKGKFAQREAESRLEVAGMNVKNLKNQIAVSSAKLGLDRDVANATILEKLSSAAKNNDKLASLPADVRKTINDAAVASGTAQMQSQRLEKMAADFASANVGSGSASKINEWFRKQTGYENGLSSLRNDYERLSKAVALKSLPAGPASNADLLFALKGIPESTSNSKEMARFLRGMAIMEKIASDSEQVKVDWLSQNNGTLAKAANGFSTAGLTVKPGQSLAEVQSEIVKRHSTQPAAQTGPVSVSVGGRSFSFPDQKAADAFLAAAKK